MCRAVGITPVLLIGAIWLTGAVTPGPSLAQEEPPAGGSVRNSAARGPADAAEPFRGLEREEIVSSSDRWAPGAGRISQGKAAPEGDEVGKSEASSPAEGSPPAGSWTPRSGGIRSLETAWSEPSPTLEERAQRVRRAADAAGLGDLDAWARAILWGGSDGDRLEAVQAAITLAPGLPAARAAATREFLFHVRPLAATAEAVNAWRAVGNHLEASLWLGATLYALAWGACLATGFGYIALRGVAALPLVGRDLVGTWLPDTTEPARVALVVSPIVLCAALGGGLVAALLLLYVAALCYASRRERLALYGAAGCLLLALGPLARGTGVWLHAAAQDAVVEAAWSSERGFVDSTQLARLTERLGSDPLVTQVVTRRMRRQGAYAAAAAELESALADNPDDPLLLNDLGTVHFTVGDYPQAITRYRSAAERLESAVIWFNLAQAYARLFQMDRHSQALEVASTVDSDLVTHLNDRLHGRRVVHAVELPIALERYRERLFGGGGGASIAAALRARWLPSPLAERTVLVAIATIGFAVLAAWLPRRFSLSRWCGICGAMTPRSRRRCGACDEVLRPARGVGVSPGPALRIAERVGVFVPGLGLTVSRPLWALCGLLGLSLTGTALWAEPARLPDPLAVGALALWLQCIVCAGGTGLYLAAVLLRWRGRGD